MRGWKRFPAAIKCIMHNGGEIVMKTKEKKEKAAEEEKKETKPEENGVKLTDEQLEKVNGGVKTPPEKIM